MDIQPIHVVVDTRRAPADLVTLSTLARISPRNPRKAVRALLKLARGAAWAESATYPVTTPEGLKLRPSVWLARPFASAWGHLSSGNSIIATSERGDTVEGWSFDAESNRFHTLQEFVSRWVKRSKKHGDGTEVELVGEAWRAARFKVAAILERRVLFDQLPAEPVEQIMQACEATLEAESMRALDADQRAVLEGLRDELLAIGALIVDVESWLGHDMSAVAPREHARLRAIIRSVKAGDTSVGDHFGRAESKATDAPPQVVDVPAEKGYGEPTGARTAAVDHAKEGDWHAGIRIYITEPPSTWIGGKVANKGPLTGMTFGEVALTTDEVKRARVEELLLQGATEQAEKGQAGLSFQRLAKARQLAEAGWLT
jgi:hypothetical protein